MPTVTTYPGVFGPYSPITFTRTSTGTYFDSTGTLQTALDNVPRLDYNPSTLAAQGFLVEEQRTNSIRNNTMQGAVAGTPGTLPTNWQYANTGGLSSSIVGFGTENGVSYVDIRAFGTTTGGTFTVSPEIGGLIAASNGQTWTASAFLKIVGGSTANIFSTELGWSEQNSVPSFLAFSVSTISIPTSGALSTNRIVRTGTNSQPTTAFVRPAINLLFNVGVAIDITLRIGLPQLELGAFATSVIPTTTMALTRNADQASVNTLSPWYNATEGTLYCEGVSNASSVDGTNLVLSDGTNSNRIQFGTGASNTVWNPFVVVSGSSVATLTQSVSFSPKTSAKLALAYKVDDFAATTAGASPVTDPSGAVPTLNILRIGASGSGTVTWNSWIRRITYYPRRLSNAELQALTA